MLPERARLARGGPLSKQPARNQAGREQATAPHGLDVVRMECGPVYTFIGDPVPAAAYHHSRIIDQVVDDRVDHHEEEQLESGDARLGGLYPCNSSLGVYLNNLVMLH